MKNMLEFLIDLSASNKRQWFNDNKDRYETANESFEVFIEEMIDASREIDSSIGVLSPKACMFRIYTVDGNCIGRH